MVPSGGQAGRALYGPPLPHSSEASGTLHAAAAAASRAASRPQSTEGSRLPAPTPTRASSHSPRRPCRPQGSAPNYLLQDWNSEMPLWYMRSAEVRSAEVREAV